MSRSCLLREVLKFELRRYFDVQYEIVADPESEASSHFFYKGVGLTDGLRHGLQPLVLLRVLNSLKEEFMLGRLPKGNEHENLEDYSRIKFCALFDTALFAIDSDSGRDKGIDFVVEIKKDGYYTNFRFNVQLKATNARKRNDDGSISIPVETANINYILNSGNVGYYVLYYKPDDIFMYAHASAFVNAYMQDREGWEIQSTHVLRFSDTLNIDAIQSIYQEILDRGKFQRQLNEAIAVNSPSASAQSIIIEKDFEVTSESKIVEQIEAFGHLLINSAKWNEVIALHRRTSQSLMASAKYHLAVGVAYYHAGELLKSLDHVRTGRKWIDSLSPELQEYIRFFDSLLRFSLGLINSTQYESEVKEMNGDREIGLHVRIDLAKKKFLQGDPNQMEENLKELAQEFDEIAFHQNSNEYFRLVTKSELLFFEGTCLVNTYMRALMMINARESLTGPSDELDKLQLRASQLMRNKWSEHLESAKNQSLKQGNYFILNHILVNEVKILYQFEVYSDVYRWDKREKPLMGARKITHFTTILEVLSHAIDYFKTVGHVENTIVALTVKYEVHHYLEDIETARLLMSELSSLVNTYDLLDHKRKLNLLANGGTTHELLEAFLKDQLQIASERQMEHERLLASMKMMDELDKAKGNVPVGFDVIEVFPIKHFSFPQSRRDEVYDILNIAAQARKQFDYMFDEIKAIPVANINNSIIVAEGFDGPSLENKIEAWRRYHNVRKSFYERGFPRIEISL